MLRLSPKDKTDECQIAFGALKPDLIHSATLAHPDFNQAFILTVDASFDDIFAVLSQVPPKEKVACPVAFAIKSQMNYSAHMFQFLAMK